MRIPIDDEDTVCVSIPIDEDNDAEGSSRPMKESVVDMVVELMIDLISVGLAVSVKSQPSASVLSRPSFKEYRLFLMLFSAGEQESLT